jgi:hypothetical protein
MEAARKESKRLLAKVDSKAQGKVLDAMKQLTEGTTRLK